MVPYNNFWGRELKGTYISQYVMVDTIPYVFTYIHTFLQTVVASALRTMIFFPFFASPVQYPLPVFTLTPFLKQMSASRIEYSEKYADEENEYR